MAQDYYKELGVDKSASKADIKKAYRNLAKKHHPDKGGDAEKFKKISSAYETLSNDQKKYQYDKFGSAGPSMGGFGGNSGGFSGGGFQGGSSNFDGFEDIFSSFFGGGGGRQQSSRKNTKGADLEVEVEVSFEDSMNGVTKKFSSSHLRKCGKCDGVGGKGQKTCEQCHGKGQISQQMRTPFGVIQQQTTCPGCDGTGKNFAEKCSSCHGEGRKKSSGTIKVEIPSGVQSGETLRVRGQGEAGIRGGQAGDLFVHIRVPDSAKFARHGLNLYSVLDIPVFEALLGGEFIVRTFWGKVELKIPELSRDGEKFKIKGKGVKKNGIQGDHIVQIKHQMPKKITSSMRRKLEDLI